MQAVILAAGKGLRLRPFTDNHPKPLIPIADKPLLEHTLEALPDSITEIIIVIGYLAEQIQDALGYEWNGKPVRYVVQTELKGTGDALYRAKNLLENNFLVVNGDDLYKKADLTELMNHNYSILAWQSTQPTEFGLAESSDGHLTGFDPSSSLVNCGAYFLNQDFFADPLVEIEVRGSMEQSLPHTLALLAEKHPVKIVKATHWLPVGTPQQLEFANDYYIKKHF